MLPEHDEAVPPLPQGAQNYSDARDPILGCSPTLPEAVGSNGGAFGPAERAVMVTPLAG